MLVKGEASASLSFCSLSLSFLLQKTQKVSLFILTLSLSPPLSPSLFFL
jgi:hypothetical protein